MLEKEEQFRKAGIQKIKRPLAPPLKTDVATESHCVPSEPQDLTLQKNIQDFTRFRRNPVQIVHGHMPALGLIVELIDQML